MPKTLHFFPGSKQLIWEEDGQVKLRAEAWGGEAPDPKTVYNVMKPRKTTPGAYVVHSVEPYRTNTWPLSKIRWGTRLKMSADGKHVLYESGQVHQPWLPVDKLIPGVTPAWIQDQYFALYGKYLVPDKWVFNDFGEKAIRYFKDSNHNHKLDKGEALSGEMIHTTPENEAQTAKNEDVTLGYSHGCIHVKPLDRALFIDAGAFTQGTDFIVHKYEEPLPKEFQ